MVASVAKQASQAAYAHRVIASCRQPSQSNELQQLQQQYPDRLQVVQLDVTDEASVNKAADAVTSQHSHLNLLINAAAVLHIPNKLSPETALARVTYDNLLLSFQTNAMGPILVCKALAPLLAAADKQGNATNDHPAVIANMSAKVCVWHAGWQ
eukprot:jgi/Chrzof1/5766/Cz16g15030.t1